MSYERLQNAATAIADLSGRSSHAAALVLGSGLGTYAASLPDATAIPYSEIPHFPAPRVEGHSGTLYSIDVSMDGRRLTYEPYSGPHGTLDLTTQFATKGKLLSAIKSQPKMAKIV